MPVFMSRNKISEYNIILASKSPRRQELLSNLDIKFLLADIINVDETYPSNLVGGDIPLYLSKLKSKAYISSLKHNDILITADTIVWLNNKALNKPINRDDAIQMLTDLSGVSHSVYTGVSLTSTSNTTSFVSETEVFFKELSVQEIIYYVDTYKPYDKAGAYGIQEWIGYIGIEKIVGSYFNVMGLPVNKLYSELNKFINN